MLLLRILLLVMLIDKSDSTLRQVPNCDAMACFVPNQCCNQDICTGSSAGIPLTLFKIMDSQKVKGNCNALVKIRSYTSKYMLIVLESYNVEVDHLILELGTTKLECIRDQDKVTVKYRDSEESTKLLTHNISPLSCEFTVKDEANDIFDSSATVALVQLTSMVQGVRSNDFDGPASKFRPEIDPTCNPDNARAGKLGAVGEMMISEVSGKLADLTCPTGSKLMFREDSTSAFNQASKVSCEANKQYKYGYSPKPVLPSTSPQFFESSFEAHCEVPICSLCPMVPRSDPNLKYEPENGCNKLKCTEGRIQLGSSEPVDGPAECKYVNDKPEWQLNDNKIITDAAVVTCSMKKNCDVADAKRLCGEDLGKSCMLDIHNLPICFGQSNRMIFNGDEVDRILCNEDTGKYYMRMKANQSLPTEGHTLLCEEPPRPHDPAAAKAGLGTGATVGISLAILLVVGSIAAYVGFRFYTNNKKKQKGAAPNDVTVGKQAQSKSKESSKSLASLQSKKDEGTVKEEPKIEAAKIEEKVPTNSQKSNDVVRTPGGTVYKLDMQLMSDPEKPAPPPAPEVPKPTPKNEESVRRVSRKAKKGIPSDTSESKKKEEVSGDVTGGTVVGADGQRIPEAQIGQATNDATGVTGVTGKSGKTLTHGGKVSPSGEFIRRADADKR